MFLDKNMEDRSNEKRKFDPPTSRGILMGYGDIGALVVADFKTFNESQGKIRLITTRDVVVRDLEKVYEELTSELEDDEIEGTFKDNKGVLRCEQCRKVRSSDPITCPARRGRHRAHSKGNDCKLKRCGCSVAEDQQGPRSRAEFAQENEEDKSGEEAFEDAASDDSVEPAASRVSGAPSAPPMSKGRCRIRKKSVPKPTQAQQAVHGKDFARDAATVGKCVLEHVRQMQREHAGRTSSIPERFAAGSEGRERAITEAVSSGEADNSAASTAEGTADDGGSQMSAATTMRSFTDHVAISGNDQRRLAASKLREEYTRENFRSRGIR